jgi:hypothetical protein
MRCRRSPRVVLALLSRQRERTQNDRPSLLTPSLPLPHPPATPPLSTARTHGSPPRALVFASPFRPRQATITKLTSHRAPPRSSLLRTSFSAPSPPAVGPLSSSPRRATATVPTSRTSPPSQPSPLCYPALSSRVGRFLAIRLRALVGRRLAGTGRLAATAAATSSSGTPATRSAPFSPFLARWAEPRQQAEPEQAGSVPSPRERDGPRPPWADLFPRAGPATFNKPISFPFLSFLMKNNWEK